MNETIHASPLNSQIKVSLLTAKDKMYSILLPQAKEGRYFFYDSQQKRKLSFIYIEPHDNQWFVCATKNVLFSYSGFERSSQIPLEIKTFINIYQYDKKYTLYVEEVNEAEDSFHPFSIKENSEITIGRDPKCDIVFSNRLVSHQYLPESPKSEEFQRVLDAA